jgi:type II secretory ATPase GspE/PulE/Tfp pilus assembly ATPase PilB-like protein/CheY-like chemotaxis protein
MAVVSPKSDARREVRPARRAPALPQRVHDAFTAALLREQLIAPKALQAALQHAGQSLVPIHAAVVALGFVPERITYKLLAECAGLPFVDGRTVTPSPLALKLVPDRVAHRHELVPVDVDDRNIIYITATPYDVDADRDMGFTTGRGSVPNITCPSDLRTALERYYPRRGNIDQMVAKARTKSVVETITDVGDQSQTDSAIVELCNSVIARAVDAGASDIHMDPADSGILVRLRVGGVLEAALTLPADVSVLVRNRFKIMGRADIAVRNRPQDGAFAVRVSGRRIDVRLSTLPTTSGEKLVMRIIDSQSELQSIEMLGYDEELLTRLRRVLDRPDGLVLVTGPTGSGKTTSLYAALHHLRSGRVNIVSVEDPVERTLQGVNQIPVNAKSGQTFAAVLRSVLRQDPDVLMVGEIRDGEVANIVGQAAYTGHLVLSSVHTIDAPTAITRLLNLGLEPFKIAESLSGVLAQRLVRRLCPGCRSEEHNGTAVAGPGCPQCNFTGYAERVPVSELLTPTDEIRNVIARGATAVEIRQAMRAAGVPTMRDHARKLVARGVTSYEEISRVLGADDEAPPAASPQKQSVLIADDEPITRTLVRLLLDRDGYKVFEAQTGREAIDQAAAHRPDLIVMDLNMPQMDGYDAITAIRALPELAHTPIVVVSAEDGANVQQRVLALGADDYVLKPFEPAVLTERIKAVFRRQRLAA